MPARSLIAYAGRGKTRMFSITAKGKRRLRALTGNPAALPAGKYDAAPGGTMIIIIFDIPEKERRKRDWMRSALRAMGFEKVQRSVWRGAVKVPQRFIEDLRELRIADYVEIFSVLKKGTLAPS